MVGLQEKIVSEEAMVTIKGVFTFCIIGAGEKLIGIEVRYLFSTYFQGLESDTNKAQIARADGVLLPLSTHCGKW